MSGIAVDVRVRRHPVAVGAPTQVPAIEPVAKYLPAAATPDLDPNNIVASSSVDDDWLTVNLQSPGAYPLPSQGALWDCGPFRDIYGGEFPAEGPNPPNMLARVADAVPRDVWVAAFIATDLPDAADVETYGGGMQHDAPNNVNAVAISRTSAGAWLVVPAPNAVDTSSRIAILRIQSGNQTLARYASVICYGGSGATPASAVRPLTVPQSLGASGWSRVWIGVGWVAGTGGPTATVRLNARSIGASVARMISESGL